MNVRGSRQLRSDTRGAVMLIGVFMSAFLVGVLWYVIGIGDAVLYREHMQDGADASAFAAAVYQARGMNLIAMINLIMAAVLAVLVALKIAQILLIAANVASCAMAFFVPPMVPVCEATTAGEEPLQGLISTTEKIVDGILKGLYITESAIAVGMPFAAEAKSILVARDYGPTVHGGLMLSISLIPGHLTKFIGDIDSKKSEPDEPDSTGETKVVCNDGWVSSCGCDRADKGGCCSHHAGVSGDCTSVERPAEADPDAGPTPEGGNPNEGVRWGLPVEDDSFSFLCGKAGEFVIDLVFLPFGLDEMAVTKPFVGPIKNLVKGIVKSVVETFPGYFCGDGGVDMSTIKGKVRDAATTQCEERAAELAKIAEESGEPVPLIDPNGCQDAVERGLDSVPLPAGTPVGMKVPKKVYSDAQNGDNYFASWAIVWGDLAAQSSAGKLVDIAAWGKRRVADPSFVSRFHFAKSEYYFEPKKDQSGEWDDLVEDAMWNMRWRARLRRSYLPPINLGSAIAGHFHDWVEDKLGGILGEDNPAIDPIMDVISGPVDEYGEAVDDYVGEKLGNVNQGIIH